ncbi:MAG: 50S ribosomal protein L21 [Clostridia bacterium]|nr:50S ribosomal protein L21 [Clostridia bacterium]
MYAIVEIAGKQFKVSEGDIVFVPRIESLEEGATTTFDKVLLVSSDGKVSIGEEYVKGAKVTATVISHGKDKKILVYKYKAKKNERKMQGHRQPYTKIQIEKITLSSSKKAAAENVEENKD